MRMGLVLALVLAWASAARAGDPRRRYQTIETDHFVISYDAPLADVARRIAVLAERAHRTLSPALDHAPAEKTLLVLVDTTDSANGFAGTLPRNAITLFATAPNGLTELDDHDDWLHNLVTHEYTHILHIDTMSGLPNIYNRIFGKTWAPNQTMPRWLIEGIAVYEESKRSAGGRARGSRFEQFLRVARHGDYDLRLDEITNTPRRFPRGNAAYVYGSHFVRYVFDRFGDDALRAMSHASGAFPLPWAANRQIAKVTGQPFTDLYGDWKAYLRDRYGMQEMAAERRGLAVGRALTTTAETNVQPHYTADGKELIWIHTDGYREARVRAIPVGKDLRAARDVVQLDAIGTFDVLADGSLVFEQGGRLFRRDYAYQDLFRWDARTGQTIRLTRGARARDPAASPDGRRVAFSMNERSESVLAVIDAPGATPSVVWRGERFDQAFQPAWSPDGMRIAFSAWRRGGYRDILIVELASGRVEAVTADRAIDMSPAWSHDGATLYFDSDRTGIQNLYAYDVASRALWQVTNVLGGAFQAAPSPDGTRIAYQGAVPAGGSDLFELPIDRAAWLPARDYVDDRPPPSVIRDDEAIVSAPRTYRPLETLAPRAWTGELTFGDAPSATIQTTGTDAVGLHSYSLSVSTPLEDDVGLDIGAAYAYSGWRQNVRIAAARTISERGGFRVDNTPLTYRQEDWGATLSTSIPFEARPESTWTLSFDYDVDVFRALDAPQLIAEPGARLPVRPLTDYMQAGVATRVAYSSVRGASYGVGGQRGFDAAVSLRLDHPLVGAEYTNVTVSYSTQHFRRLWGKTPVLAARLGGSFRSGDLVRAGAFSLGGVPSQDIARAIVDSTRVGVTGYLRGYAPRAITGNQVHLLNLEYRQELLQIERGIATLPIYVRRLHAGVLADVGTAFDTEFDADRNLKKSLGAALRLDATFGFFVTGTFEVGVSRGLDDGGITESWLLLTGTL